MIWLWAAMVLLTCVSVILAGKVFMLKKDAREIREAFADRLAAHTNTLIDISHQDKEMKMLAEEINVQLRKLRYERHRFQQGDKELKDAVTNISHDLRTPLTAILGYLQLIEREEINEEIRGYIRQIENRTEVLKQLTEELFKYSVVSLIDDTKKEMMDLKRALEESMISFYGAMKQRGIEPEINMTEKRVERLLDSKAVSRIFGNIISNALKYSDGDFRITMDDNGEISFSNKARQLDHVSVGRLFDRFYTVESGRNSTGLGLSIAKLLTERMGGIIKAQYHNDEITVSISFPEKLQPRQEI